MIPVIVIVGICVLAVVFALLIRKSAGQEKQAFLLMQTKGTPVAATKENIPEMNILLNTVLPLLDRYVNGPDQSMRARHNVTPVHYVKLPDNGILFDAWIQRGYSSNKPQSDLYVIECTDGAITHVVRASDYTANAGSFDSLVQATFENTDPK